MSKEELIQEYENKRLIEELSKMPPMVIATAYLHAINYTLYGEDVTEKWVTATQNASVLKKAYNKGYYDAMQKLSESEGDNGEDIQKLPSVNSQPKTGYWIKTSNGFKCSKCLIVHKRPSIYCPSCGAKMIELPESEDKE